MKRLEMVIGCNLLCSECLPHPPRLVFPVAPWGVVRPNHVRHVYFSEVETTVWPVHWKREPLCSRADFLQSVKLWPEGSDKDDYSRKRPEKIGEVAGRG